ncbi:MAG: hypothetical protein ACHQ6V_01100 [Myxococcota bacterium]
MISHDWGATEAERALRFPHDPALPDSRDLLYRGVDVAAPAPLVFRWLCQLRAAPYSYDWIDNAGRRSPRELTPGLEALELGQRFMSIFRLVAFERDVALTLATPPGSRGARLFGVVEVTYWARALEGARTRLLAKLRVEPAPGALGGFMRAFLPWGDLVMMRRQLLNLKRLAERSAAHPLPLLEETR